MSNERKLDRYHFEIGKGTPDYDADRNLIAKLLKKDIAGITEFFLPHIKAVAKFYAAQTDQPNQNYDELYSEGCIAVIEAIESYKLQYVHCFQTYIKRHLIFAIEDECQKINDSRPLISQKDFIDPKTEKGQNHPKLTMLEFALNNINPKYSLILREHFLNRSTLEEIAGKFGCVAENVRQQELKALRQIHRAFRRLEHP